MTRKNSNMSREVMFLGNSLELKAFLSKKRKFFKEYLEENKQNLGKEQREKINNYIRAIDDMLDQTFFKGSRIYSMPDLIQAVKEQRADVIAEMQVLELEVATSRKLADEAFKEQGSYIANCYEDEYNSPEQSELRLIIDEYQMLDFQYENVKMCEKALRWLLGVIHRPTGFFEKVI